MTGFLSVKNWKHKNSFNTRLNIQQNFILNAHFLLIHFMIYSYYIAYNKYNKMYIKKSISKTSRFN
jgi:hypothetical protein